MIRWPATELDATSFPAWRETIDQLDTDVPAAHATRAYPGYPRVPLPAVRRRWRSSLERALADRRSNRALATTLPTADELARICKLAHGVNGESGRGPVPSAGGLQAIELYCAALAPGWLPAGWHHYDRAAHALARVTDAFDPATVPALITITGGALAWAIVGDGARVDAKYGARGLRFLLLEAGHLMQNLCLVSAELGLATIPVGGFYEQAIASALALPPADEVLYVGVCGRPA